MQVQLYRSFGDLPQSYSTLFAERADPSVFTTRRWIETYVANAREPGENLHLFGVEEDGPERLPIAIMAGFASRLYSVHPRARVLRFFQADSVPYSPVVSKTLEQSAGVLEQVIEKIYEAQPQYEVVRFSPLDPVSSLYGEIIRILHEAGQLLQTYFIFANRYEVIDGRAAEEYFRDRPSALRNTLRRKDKKLDGTGHSRFELVTGGDILERAILDYDRVFAASWKKEELLLPIQYVHGVMRCAADAGALRLGLLYVDDQPAATQFWIASADVAHCYRLAYNEQFSKFSVGSILTQRMIEQLIDVDGVKVIDFGIGDDPYKRDWATSRRERWGIVAFNPRTVRGVKGALRHIGGRAIKRGFKKLVRPIDRFRSRGNSGCRHRSPTRRAADRH